VMHGLHKAVVVRSQTGSTKRNRDDKTTASLETEAPESELSVERLSEVAKKLRNFAAGIAEDVDAHQTRVQAVNVTLQDQPEGDLGKEIVTSVNELIAANEWMQRQLQSAQGRIQEQAVQLESAEKRAQTDALTRVSNRRAFDERLEEQHRRGPDDVGALMILDVDHFKQFNDVYGHRAGDEVLRIVAGVLNARLQPYGMVARFGGEEFAVLLNREPRSQTLERLEQAREAICQREILFEGQCLRVTACIGVAFLQEGESSAQWLQRADDALYRSKADGRNNGHWMDGETARRIRLTPAKQTNLTPSSKNSGTAPMSAGAGGTSAGTGGTSAGTGSSVAFDSTDPSQGNHAAEAGVRDSSEAGNGAREGRLKPTSVAPGDSDASTETSGKVAGSSDNDRESNNRSANANAQKSSKKKVEAFAYLPDRIALAETFEDLHRRSQAMDMPTHLLAVHFQGDVSSFKMRSLLQVVRASSRNIDRIGCEDGNVLLMVMPSADENTAMGRAQQIVAAAQSLRLGPDTASSSERQSVSVGIVDAAAHSEFDQLVEIALSMAKSAAEDGNDLVSVYAPPSLAVE